jgi:hypothetical protein
MTFADHLDGAVGVSDGEVPAKEQARLGVDSGMTGASTTLAVVAPSACHAPRSTFRHIPPNVTVRGVGAAGLPSPGSSLDPKSLLFTTRWWVRLEGIRGASGREA